MSEIHRIHAFITMLMLIGMLIILTVSLFIFGPIIESAYFPVTKDVKVKFLSQTSEKMLFRAEGRKVRNCALISTRVLVFDDINKPAKKGAIYVVDDGEGDTIRALGYQDLGVWAILPPGNELHVQATYHCHPFWNTEVQLGEWHR